MMKLPRSLLLWVVVGALLVIVAGGLSACGRGPAMQQPPASVQKSPDGGPSRLTLTPQAVKRLDIQTVAIQAAGRQLSVPYSAVIYDADGHTWVFTNPEALVFVRAPVTVHKIQGSTATLSSGPPAGTLAVTVGAEELWGTELGVGHE
jgi:uncharacterized iron-regulated membrane protein